jgi:hypothetical protein
VLLPEALRPYMRGQERIKKRVGPASREER